MVTFCYSFAVILIIVLISDAEVIYDSVCGDGKKCVPKCCPNQTHVYDIECASNVTLNKDFRDFNVYDENLIRTKSLKDAFDIVNGQLWEIAFNASQINFYFYLLEDGNLHIKTILPNTFPISKTLKNGHFCIDYKLEDDGTFTPVYGINWEEDTEENQIIKNPFFQVAALIISNVFLLLVLVIYSLLKELRNLKGKILMAMVFSLFGAFTVLATSKILSIRADYILSHNECIGYPSAFYFLILSSFCWMNVMSFDIWWTLRKMTNRATIRGNRDNRKFLFYCVYAWGLPLAMTIALVLMEKADLSHMPWIIKPNIARSGCFLTDKEKLLYLYVPMLILILCNCVLFLMTACNIWYSGKQTQILNSDAKKKHNVQKQRFLIYLKLSLVMGISYILEVFSSFYPNFSFWFITDAYNMLIGVAIFFIFVCKKRTFIKLSKRLKRKETNNIESNGISISLSTSRN